MTHNEWTRKQANSMMELLLEPDAEPQIGKDIQNLKYLMYDIGYQSGAYRRGCYNTLKRVIALLEARENNGE